VYFHQLFNAFSERKERTEPKEKQAKSGRNPKSAEKFRVTAARHKMLGCEERVHTQCGTWNNFPLGRLVVAAGTGAAE
jgi:hypothetical protein